MARYLLHTPPYALLLAPLTSKPPPSLGVLDDVSLFTRWLVLVEVVGVGRAQTSPSAGGVVGAGTAPSTGMLLYVDGV